MNKTSLASRARAKGMRMTDQRKLIAGVIDVADNHPDAEEIYQQASQLDAKISLATVYRTLRQFEEAGILDRLDFGDGRARYEDARRSHHDHLVDVDTGEIVEFVNQEIEALQENIAKKYGYELVGHRLELFGRKIKD